MTMNQLVSYVRYLNTGGALIDAAAMRLFAFYTDGSGLGPPSFVGHRKAVSRRVSPPPIRIATVLVH
jgi:hypothetical protein